MRRSTPTEGERVLRRLGEPAHLAFLLDRLGKSTKMGEAQDQPGAIVDRCRRVDSNEVMVGQVGRQRLQIVRGQLNRLLVLPAMVVSLSEIGRGQELELHVPKLPGNS